MHPGLRACIALIAGRLITGREISTIHDESRSSDISIEGTVTAKKVNIFDHGRGCHVAGINHGECYSLYDFGGQSYVDLTIDGSTFEGYDDQVPCGFRGEVNEEGLSFYDDGLAENFIYRFKD